jgi:uncharacterized iron-regulated membrane protein
MAKAKVAYKLVRRLHKWFSLIVALPLIVIFATGVLLSISPKIAFLQPEAKGVTPPGISISFDRILESARSVTEAEIDSWSDISQIDARPISGVVRVRAKNYWEVQINGHTGEVLSSAPRWKTLLIMLHDGSWFGSWVKAGIVLPAGIAAVLLWLSGIALLIAPAVRKRT